MGSDTTRDIPGERLAFDGLTFAQLLCDRSPIAEASNWITRFPSRSLTVNTCTPSWDVTLIPLGFHPNRRTREKHLGDSDASLRIISPHPGRGLHRHACCSVCTWSCPS